jgi:hypothetical protein
MNNKFEEKGKIAWRVRKNRGYVIRFGDVERRQSVCSSFSGWFS